MSNFSQGQGEQGVAREYDSTSHKETRSLTQKLRKRAIYGWKLANTLSSGSLKKTTSNQRERKMTKSDYDSNFPFKSVLSFARLIAFWQDLLNKGGPAEAAIFKAVEAALKNSPELLRSHSRPFDLVEA